MPGKKGMVSVKKEITRQQQIFMEVRCIKNVSYAGNYSHKSQFIKGNEYVAQLKRTGTYEIDNEVGHGVKFTPDEFAKHFINIKS